MSPTGPGTTRKEPQGGEPQGGEPQGGEPQGGELWAAVAEPSRRLFLDVLLAHGEARPCARAGPGGRGRRGSRHT
jgi:hypothetical protein